MLVRAIDKHIGRLASQIASQHGMCSPSRRTDREHENSQRLRWSEPMWSPRRNRTGDPILTMEPPGTAVRNAVSPGHARPSRPKLSVLFRSSYALCQALCRSLLLEQASTVRDRQLIAILPIDHIPLALGSRRHNPRSKRVVGPLANLQLSAHDRVSGTHRTKRGGRTRTRWAPCEVASADDRCLGNPGTELRATEKQSAYHLGRRAMQMIDLYLMTAREGAGQRQPAWTAVKRVMGALSPLSETGPTGSKRTASRRSTSATT
jgi:hypothetical protein